MYCEEAVLFIYFLKVKRALLMIVSHLNQEYISSPGIHTITLLSLRNIGPLTTIYTYIQNENCIVFLMIKVPTCFKPREIVCILDEDTHTETQNK